MTLLARNGSGRASAVLAAAVLVALTGCGISIPPLNQPGSSGDSTPTSEQGSTVTSEFSTLDAQGMATILDTGRARFDFSRGDIPKHSLRLDDSAAVPDIQSTDGPITLEIEGPDGTLTASTDHVRFGGTNSSPTVPRITYFLISETPAELFQQLRDASSEYGIDSGDVEAWIDSRESGSDAAGASDFAFDPGSTLGMNVSYDVRYDESKTPQVIIVQVSPLG